MKPNGLRGKKPDPMAKHLEMGKYSQEMLLRLKDNLEYFPTTGMLLWKISRGRCSGGEPAGTQGGDYVRIKFFGFVYKAHILCWALNYGHWPKGFIDHINGCGLDNRAENLREATQETNMHNMGIHRGNKSGCPGVYLCKRDNLWKARIAASRKRYSLGCFKSFEEAKNAYLEGKKKLHPDSPSVRWHRAARTPK